MTNFKLPLATINHSFWDRIKLASFFLKPSNRWSMSDRVKEVEENLAERSAYKYCVATSSGSTANTLLAMWVKENTKKKKVVVPAVTWATSISPWILHNFEPIFVDVDEKNPVMGWRNLETALNENKGEVACVFHTTLLGIRSGLEEVRDVCDRYMVDLYVDSCEDTEGIFYEKELQSFALRTYDIKAETTSFYLAHEYQAGPEMGAVFTNDLKQYEYFLCARNHGMLRSLDSSVQKHYKNDLVDPKFDFPFLGNNFRPTEISAYTLLLDLKRSKKYGRFRYDAPRDFYFRGTSKINHYGSDAMFALPLVVGREFEQNKDYFIDKIKGIVDSLGIEYRPIVGGNLLRQTCFSQYGNYLDYPNAEWFHNYGIYIGLYPKMDKKILNKLQKELDRL